MSKGVNRAIKAIPLVLAALYLAACGGRAVPEDTVVFDVPALMTPVQTPAIAPGALVTPAPTTHLPAQPEDAPAKTQAPEQASASPTAGATATATPTAVPAVEEEAVKTYIADGFYYQKLDDALKKRITGMSFPADDEDCKITYDDLRYVGIRYVDFSGKERDGELIVNRKLAKEVAEIFLELYEKKYPLASVRLVDDYGEPGDDNRSMAANNTSAFNYRRVTGSSTLSRHSYGAAIDINPLYNPYIVGDRVAPPDGAAYVDRTQDFPGKIDEDDLCYKLFTERGWEWGGHFKTNKDYQHFSKDIN